MIIKIYFGEIKYNILHILLLLYNTYTMNYNK